MSLSHYLNPPSKLLQLHFTAGLVGLYFLSSIYLSSFIAWLAFLTYIFLCLQNSKATFTLYILMYLCVHAFIFVGTNSYTSCVEFSSSFSFLASVLSHKLHHVFEHEF